MKSTHIIVSPIVPEPTAKRITEIQISLKTHYANIALLYAFACGEQNLSKQKNYSRRAQRYERGSDDDQRLLETVTNLKKNIAKEEQELFDLIRKML
jgi:hypothetical protein